MIVKRKNKIRKVKEKVRKVPLGTGLLRRSVSSITKRDKKQKDLLRKIGF